MKRNSIFLFVLCVVFFVHVFGASSSNTLSAKSRQSGLKSSSGPIIANIKNQKVNQSCGCFFSYPSERKKRFGKYMFISNMEEGYAWMNIDGHDVKFQLVRSFNPKVERIGSRLTRTYAANGITVSVVYITRRLCPPNEENCESTDYDATFTVSKGGRRKTLKFWGGCGC